MVIEGVATEPIKGMEGSFVSTILVDFPLPHDLGPVAAPPEVHMTTLGHTWPSPPPPLPKSPGAALIQEFDALYHKYERRVYRQCYRMLGNREDAEDVAQEVFLQLFRKAHTFRGEASFSTWLHRLTVNTVLMQLRRHRRLRDAVTSLDAPGTENGASDILTMVSALRAPATTTLDKVCLDVAIAELPCGYREIFLLHDLEGYRHDEIAKLLGISEGTSKSQLHKARLRLRGFVVSAGRGCDGYDRVPGSRARRKQGCHAPLAAEYAQARCHAKLIRLDDGARSRLRNRRHSATGSREK